MLQNTKFKHYDIYIKHAQVKMNKVRREIENHLYNILIQDKSHLSS